MSVPEDQPPKANLAALQKRAFVGAAWTVMERWGTRVLSLVVFAMLGRLLPPSAFGLIALSVAIIDLLNILVKQGIAQHLVVDDTEITTKKTSTAFWLSLGTSVVLAGAVVACAPLIAAAFDEPQLKGVVMALALVLPFNALGTVQAALLRREFRFGALSSSTLASTVAGSIVAITCAFAGAGVWSLVAQYVTTVVVNVIGLSISSRFRPTFEFDRKQAKSYLSFGSSIIGLDALTYLTRNGDNFLIGAFLGSTALGYYAVAYRILMIVTELFVGVISSVVLPVFARLRGDMDAMRRGIIKATRYTTSLALPIYGVIGVMAPEIIPVIFGEKWDSSAPILQALCVAGAINAAIYFSGNVLIANGRPRLALSTSAIATVIYLIAFAVAVQWGTTAVAIGFAVGALLGWPARLWAIKSVTGLSIGSYFAQWWRPAVSTAVALAVMFGLRRLAMDWPDLFSLALCIPLGLLVYGIVLLCVDRRLFGELTTLLDKVRARFHRSRA